MRHSPGDKLFIESLDWLVLTCLVFFLGNLTFDDSIVARGKRAFREMVAVLAAVVAFSPKTRNLERLGSNRSAM